METLLRFFTQNRLLVNLILITIFIAGAFSIINIKRESMPNVNPDMMFISVLYPGASAQDVEVNATIPIEDELKGINGIDYTKSFSIENQAMIFVYIESDLTDTQKVKDEIFRKITASNIKDIPEEVDKIIVTEMNPKIFPVFSISVAPKKGTSVSEKELHEFVDDFEKMLKRQNGVNSISKNGYREREIQINVSPKKLEEHYISLNEIVTSIQKRNVRSTGGTLQSLDRQQNIVTIGQFEHPLDVGDVIVRSGFEQKRIHVRDLASVDDTFEDAEIRMRTNGQSAVILNVVKKENADIIATVEGVKKFLADNKNLYKDRFDIEVVNDQTLTIKSLLDVVLSNAVMGFVLVILILFLFLDLGTSVWTAIGIPVSLMMVFTFMYVRGETLNIISLGAIITVLGMLVDHGIVIAEEIYENRQKGIPPLDATINGVKSVITPVSVTVITTIMAFLPLLAIGGMMGKFVATFPIIVIATLIFSFIEATIILPNHLAGLKPPKEQKKSNWLEPLLNLYARSLGVILKNRYLAVAGIVALLIGTIFISQGTIKKFVLFYDNSADTIHISLEGPRGNSLDATGKLTETVEKIVTETIPAKERLSLVTTIGNHDTGKITQGNYENWSLVTVNLVPLAERSRDADAIVKELRNKINREKLPKFNHIVVNKLRNGPPLGNPIEIRIVSNNEKKAVTLQKELESFLGTLPGVKSIDNDQKGGKEELKLKLDYAKLADYGLTVQDVARTVRTAYEGTKATYIQTTTDKIEFRVQIDRNHQRSRKFLEELLVPNNSNRQIAIKDVASFVIQDGKTIINHYDGDRIITVTADVDDKITTPSKVRQQVSAKFSDLPKRFPGVYITWGGEMEKTDETMGGVGMAFAMAFLVIYFFLVIMFKSLSQPFLILATVPFGLTGVLLAFTAHGMPLSFFALIGIIGLVGVVVNDSVVMVDFINRTFKENTGITDREKISSLIIQGARQRFRPVILTTLTTVVALMPTVYGIGGHAQMLQPTVMAMAYGLLFATILTLFFIPALYFINDDLGKGLERIKVRIASLTGKSHENRV